MKRIPFAAMSALILLFGGCDHGQTDVSDTSTAQKIAGYEATASEAVSAETSAQEALTQEPAAEEGTAQTKATQEQLLKESLPGTYYKDKKDPISPSTLHVMEFYVDANARVTDATDHEYEEAGLSDCGLSLDMSRAWTPGGSMEELLLDFTSETYPEACGAYYKAETLFMPDALERPLNRADLLSLTENDIHHLKNQFYAIHRRKFQDEELNDYFISKIWYEPLYEAEVFFVRISADPSDWEDHGMYYTAKGRIGLPVKVTAEQYVSAMKESETVELLVDVLTGETALMTATDDVDRGSCILYFEGSSDKYYFHLSYEPFSNSYILWKNSADALFCPVYQGDIYILKGAEEEYYRYFTLHDHGDKKEAPGSFRYIDADIDDKAEGGGTSEAAEEDEQEQIISDYIGNKPVFDEKGYLKALYYYGD